MSWNRKHLLDIESLSADEIVTVLDTAKAFKAVGERAIKKVPGLARQNRRQPVHRTVHAHAHQL
jgi:aspartate carbamoyltransferase catalytic subunit